MSETLTLDKLLEVNQKLTPVVYYYTSEVIENADAYYQIPSLQARAGFDLVCHPSRVAELHEAWSSQAILRPMDDVEIRRRTDLAMRTLWDGQ